MSASRNFDEEKLSSEKEAVMHLEHQPRGLSSDDEEFLANFSDEAKATVLRKVCRAFLVITYKNMLTARCVSRSMYAALFFMLLLISEALTYTRSGG